MGEGGYRQISKTLNADTFAHFLTAQQKALPDLPDVEQISPLVIRVLGQNPGKFTLQGTNTYIVGGGQSRILIDTGQGFREWADLIAQVLKDRDIELSHVLLSHWHGDHSGGVPDLIRMFPHLAKGGIFKHSPDPGQETIDDLQVFHTDGACVRAIHSPGHSHDHMAFVLEQERAMFTGDNILGHGTSAVEELDTYMQSLSRMGSEDCCVGYPAHGAVIDDLRAKITNELSHRVRREDQVLSALKPVDGPIVRAIEGRRSPKLTTAEIVDTIYGIGLSHEIRDDALEPFVDEVLRKLVNDGKIAFSQRKNVKRWFALE